MAGTTPICSYCGKPIVGDITWGCGVEVYHPECTAPWHRPGTPDDTEVAARTLNMNFLSEEELQNVLGCEKVISFVHEARKRGKSCGGCLHQKFIIDEEHGSVQCADCEETVSAFHALVSVAKSETRFRRQMATLRHEYETIKNYKPWLKAVKKLESMWRGRKMLPCCPHCKRGIKAEDLANFGAVGIEYEEKRKNKELHRARNPSEGGKKVYEDTWDERDEPW